MMDQIWIKIPTVRSCQRLVDGLANGHGWGGRPVRLPFSRRNLADVLVDSCGWGGRPV